MVRKILRVVSVFITAISLSICVMPLGIEAHEVFPNHRWARMTSSTVSGKTVYTCYLAVSGYYLCVDTSNLAWNGQFIPMLNAWNNNSNGQVYLEYYDKDEAYVWYRCIGTTASFEAAYGVDVFGVTELYNFETHQGKQCGIDYPNCATRIKMASVMLTPKNVMSDGYTLTSDDRLKIMVHETGHIVCLGHHSSPDVSIMRQGTYAQVGYITIPQAQERTDLASMYNQIYN